MVNTIGFPADCCMAIIALFRGDNMLIPFARIINIIVTLNTCTFYSVMIHLSGTPAACVMTTVTTADTRNVIR